ncbi:hypothetical protein [Sphingobacterium hotanense]|uniref:hypothetical protein n=1 Tax=Sphingobacterium hotanense TaxID=649196 RepID=UPI0011F2F474|nr:hypothetical protein [Sphingobacterium hotanense]
MNAKTNINYLFSPLLILIFTSWASVANAQQELMEQINALSKYYLTSGMSFEIKNTNGDAILSVYDEDTDEEHTVYLNLKNDFWIEDIQLDEDEEGHIIRLTPKKKLKLETNDGVSSIDVGQYFQIFSKVNGARTSYLHDRIIAFAKAIGTKSK